MDDAARAAYWRHVYAPNAGGPPPSPQPPSSFAAWTVQHLRASGVRAGRVIDVGSGDARDSLFFAACGYDVVAVDPAAPEVVDGVSLPGDGSGGRGSVTFLRCDCAAIPRGVLVGAAAVYARFFLHAVPLGVQTAFLEALRAHTAMCTLLYVETRSMNDAMRLRGTPLSPTENVTDHYRRYMTHDELTSALRAASFQVVSISERPHLSPRGDDDPVLLRAVAVHRPTAASTPGSKHGSTRAVLRALLRDVAAALAELRVTYAVAYGTLLGVARDGDVIENDDDLDLWVPRAEHAAVLDAQLVPMLERRHGGGGGGGGGQRRFAYRQHWPEFGQLMDLSTGLVCDFYLTETDARGWRDTHAFWGHCEQQPPWYVRLPAALLLPLCEQHVPAVGCTLSLPAAPLELVRHVYGSRFRERLRKHLDYAMRAAPSGGHSVEYLDAGAPSPSIEDRHDDDDEEHAAAATAQ